MVPVDQNSHCGSETLEKAVAGSEFLHCQDDGLTRGLISTDPPTGSVSEADLQTPGLSP